MHISRRFLKQITQHIHDPEQIDITHRYRTGQEPGVMAIRHHLSSLLRMVHCGGATLWLLRLSNPWPDFQKAQQPICHDLENICIEKIYSSLTSHFLQANQFFVITL
jgi:hypothetical protein